MIIYIDFEADCGDADDAVCIGFSFKCPCCSKEVDIQPRGHLWSYYLNMLYSWSVPSGILIRCPHCRSKFRALSNSNGIGETSFEIIK